MAAAAAANSSWKPLLRTAGVGFVGGVLIWGAGDVLGEFTTFMKLREGAMVLANDNQELKDQIGQPFSLGPWYNASIGFTAGGNIAMCTFQLQVSAHGGYGMHPPSCRLCQRAMPVGHVTICHGHFTGWWPGYSYLCWSQSLI